MSDASVDALGETLGGGDDTPAPAPSSSVVRRLSRGTMIDRYVILELLGAGGMGEVFAAYDPELDRRVAIKLLRGGRASGSHQARLQREAKAMAKLSHPNVVIVHDVGTYDGDLFVAMELVEGKTLKAWLALRRPWQEVLRVFVQAGRGLEAAHAAGIAHRDFKPDNVLVRTDGRALVTDFGLARSLATPTEELRDTPSSSQEMTQAGALVGTPAYMSPEQLAGQQADTRSDQWSFCLALYEGLYGERPFDMPTISETGEPDPQALDEARYVVPPPPRDSPVPARVRRAVLRGLSVDPRARYPSLTELLAELSYDPRRTRTIATTAAVMVIVVAGGIAWSATRSREKTCAVPRSAAMDAAWNADVQQRMRAAFAASQRPYWTDTFQRVVGELDRNAAGWRTAWVDACEATHVRHAQSAALLDLRMQCLDRRAREVGALVELFARAKEPDVVDRAIKAVAALPDTRECADAERLSARVPLPSDPALRERIAALRARLDEQVAKFRAGKARALVESAAALADETATVAYPPLEAEARYWAAEVFGELGDGKGAETQLRRGLQVAASGRDDVAISRALNALVYVLGHHQQRYAESDALAGAAEALAVRLDDARQRADLVFFRGIVAEDQGNYKAARPLLEQALAERIMLVGAEHHEVARIHHNLGVVLDELGEWDAARGQFERAHAILERSFGAEHPAVGVARLGLGGALRRQGKLADARPHFEASLRIWQAAYGPEHPYVGMGLNNLLVLLHDMREHEAALDVGLRALAFKEKHSGPETESTANTLANLGRLLREMKRHAEARPYLERALAVRRKVLKPDHPDIATSLTGLALAMIEDGKPTEAQPLVKEALAIREKLGVDHPELLAELATLAQIQEELGKPAAGIPYLERAVAIAKAKPVEPEMAAEVRFHLAKLLWDRDRARATKLAEEARDAWLALGAAGTAGVADVNAWLSAHQR